MTSGFDRAKTPFHRAWHYVADGVWDVDPTSLSKLRRFGVKTVRVAHLAVKGFIDDQCPLHASSLTFSTLMSIVPILAVSLAVASGLGAGKNFEQWCRDTAKEQISKHSKDLNKPAAGGEQPIAAPAVKGGETAVPAARAPTEGLSETVDMVITWIFSSVGNVSFNKLGGVGLLILVWSVVQVLGRAESSFNKVWGVTAGRPLHRKILDYLSVLIIVPILAIAASSLPALSVISRHLDPALAGPLTGFLEAVKIQGLIVVAMTTMVFAFMIMFMPNTKVKLHCGLGGGLVAALLFIGWMKLCVAMQIGVVKYSSIYGTFAAVPIVLFWVYVSWQIILLGAEVAFALQNVSTYRMEMQAHAASARSRFVVALSVIRAVAGAMQGSEPVFDSVAYVKEKKVPVRLLNQVLRELVAAGLLAEVSGRPGYFVLLKSPDIVTIKEVFNVVFGSGLNIEASGLNLGSSITDVIRKTDAGLETALAGISAKSLAVKV
mgnify:CR=1 FL=1